jgi:hypothetical protein
VSGQATTRAAGADDVEHLRVQLARQHDLAALVAMVAAGDADGLGHRGRLVEQ